jgi:hypothetical protein
MFDSLLKKLLRRPGGSNDAGLTGHTDTPPNPATVSIRPSVRLSNGIIKPMMPAPTRDPNAPLINPKLLKRPMPAEFSATSPISDVAQPVPYVGERIRPRRPSEQTQDAITLAENTPATNEDRGFKSHAWDAIKQAGKGFLQGYAQTGNLGFATGSAIGGAGHQIADPALDEKQKRQKKLAELYGLFDRQTKMEGEQEKIRKQQMDIDNIEADNKTAADKQALAEKKYDLDVDKVLDKREFDEWRMRNGNEKLSDTQAYNKWRMELGDKKQASDQEFRNWRRDAQKADIALRTRDLDLREKRDADNLGIQQQKIQLTREDRAQKTKEFMKRNNLSFAQLKAQLTEKVRTDKISQEQMDEMLRDAQ